METARSQGCLHVWVVGQDQRMHPGLVVAWRRDARGHWLAYVAIALDGSVLLTWHGMTDVRPVTDDRPQ